MKTEKHGDAYNLVKAVYDQSPGRSWRRLNGALQTAMDAAIIGHLSFLPGDFEAIRRDTNGGYWMGDGAGSALGERYYTLAVSVRHTPACISFEKYAGRPAVLWAEDVKTPERLREGSKFTWKGQKVTVTSLRDESLMACTYKHGAALLNESYYTGGVIYWSRDYRRIEQVVIDGDLTHVRMRREDGLSNRTEIEKRFTIPYAEIAAVRKEYDKQRREVLEKIASIETEADFVSLSEEIAAQPRNTFRHFDIEEIRKALGARRESLNAKNLETIEKLSEEAALAKWRDGEEVDRWFKTVCLRVNGDYVQVSTGQSVTLKGARRLLGPMAELHKKKAFGRVSGHDVDAFEVRELQRDGIQIGCTFIPWSEVERIAPQIKASK